MTFQLSTQRLTLRAFSPSDAADALSVYGDDRVLRFWTSEPLRTCDEARDWCAEQEAAHERRGYAQWRVAERDGPFAGCVGLQPLETGEIELVYALRPDMWGRGYAREAADAALAFAFGRLRMDEVVAIVRPANDASVRVARAVGMVRKGVGTYFGSAWDRYVIERPLGGGARGRRAVSWEHGFGPGRDASDADSTWSPNPVCRCWRAVQMSSSRWARWRGSPPGACVLVPSRLGVGAWTPGRVRRRAG